ncbi:MAG TPA: deoxyribonuclease IV [Dehalococcoidia bacterium]|nr:deoxyribonuclease IV [Dehalococcoidia bacterium]
MKIGAHVSTADALSRCVDRCCEIGAEAVQIFASAPQSWRPLAHGEEAIAQLKSHAVEAEVAPIFVHGIYLINLAAESAEHVEKSVTSLAAALQFCEGAGALGTIFHVGSHKGAGFDTVRPRIVAAMQEALTRAPGESWLIIENSAGAGNTIAAKFAEIGELIRETGSDRVKVCIDTCHAFASGYDIAEPAGIEAAMAEFDREIGLHRLVAVHANDSKGPLLSGKDRHENIGEGYIGIGGFRTVMSHPAFRDVPFLLEVPGFTGKGPDRENVEILKRLRDEVFG